MNRQKLFFKNMFKNIIKNQLQLVMVILLMFLSVFVFTLTDSSSQRLTESQSSFIKKSNLHDTVIKFTGSSYNFVEDDAFRTITNTDLRNEIVMNYLKYSLDQKNDDLKFNFDRFEARSFTLSTEKTLKVIALDPDKTVDKFVVSTGMGLSTWNQYAKSQSDLTKRWVYLSESFAKANNIQINDIVRLNDDPYGTSIKVKDSEKNEVDLTSYENQDINSWITNSNYSSMNWFQVVGYGATADFMAPIVSNTSPLPNGISEGLVYVNPKNFGWDKNYLSTSFSDVVVNKMQEVITNLGNFKVFNTNTQTQGEETLRAVSNQDKEVYYSVKFLNKNIDTAQASAKLNKILTDVNIAKNYGLTSSYLPASESLGKLVYDEADSDYTFKLRTDMFKKIVLYFRLVMYISTIIIIAIGVWILVIILKSNIQKTFGQNGVLISLGYKKRELILSNCLYPIFISSIGAISGYLLALPFQTLVIEIFSKYFTIKFLGANFSWVGLVSMVLGLFTFLLVITLLTYIIMFSKYTTLQMINYENISTTSKFKIKFKKLLTNRKNFNSRFRGAILSSSISKFVSITSVMLVSSTLIAVGVVAPDMLNNFANYMYKDNLYDNQIEYQTPLYNAPTTFYKTYNPNSEKVMPDADGGELATMYLNNEISANVYTPKNDVSTLSDLNYKNLNKEFLTNQNLTLDADIQGIDSSILRGTIISSVWSDYKNYKLDQYTNKEKLLEILKDSSTLMDRLEDVENLRTFYIKYRNTIGLNIRRPEYFSGTQLNAKNDAFITSVEMDELSVPNFINPVYANSGKIRNDSFLEKSFYEDLDSGDANLWRLYTARYSAQIYNWIKAYFMDNIQQGFLQGIYVSSPESMRKIMIDSFNNDEQQFNALFNIIPYNQATDDLGVYLNATSDETAFKIYGISADNKNQALINIKGENLKSEIFKSMDNMVINESLARILGLKVGDELDAQHFYQALAVNGSELDPTTWDASALDAADADGFTNQQEIYAKSIVSANNSGWKNSTITADDYIYNTSVDAAEESMTKPTVMSSQVNNGSVTKQMFSKNKTYKVVGISRQYGSPKVWVQNDTIKKVAGYDQTQAVLFQTFLKEWENPKNYQSSSLLTTLVDQIPNWQTTDTKEYVTKFQEFLDWTKQTSNNAEILTLFENEYPIFNYKSSQDSSFADISQGVTASQEYGDFSSYGLTGGTSNSQSITGYQMAGISSAIQISAAIQVQNRVFTNVKLVIYYVLGMLLFLCLIIIMLIVNLVIVKYQKIIAVLKVLGYRDRYILSIFVGMYVPVVVFTTIIGFIIGVVIMWGLSTHLVASGIVIPLFIFTWWYPLATLLIVWVIYTLSSITSWEILKRVRLLLAVQEG